MVVVNGNCGEIARGRYFLPRFFKITGKSLSILAYMKNNKIAERVFGSWLESTQKATSYGIDLYDLFYWEHKNANWVAMALSEYDIAFDSLSPFNCRKLIETMLSVDRKYRISIYNKLHNELILKMWPELLRYPINPPENFNEATSNILKRLGINYLYKYLKFAYLYFKS